jgi:hypothetical protein
LIGIFFWEGARGGDRYPAAASHGATMITDPATSSSVVQTPLVVHHP